MAGNCFDITPFEVPNANYAYAQLGCVAPEGSIDGHFPGHFLHDMLARHCVKVCATDTGLSVHMRRLYAALANAAHLWQSPFDYGHALNQLCYVTAALGCPRSSGSHSKYGAVKLIGLSRTIGARMNQFGTTDFFLSGLTGYDGESSTHYTIAFKDIQKAAKCGVIVKPKPSEIQCMLKKLAAYLPSTIQVNRGSIKNAQPTMETSTSRGGRRTVEYVDSIRWSLLMNTVRQLPARPACPSEHMASIRTAYARLHQLRSQFATWAFAQPVDFGNLMWQYDTKLALYLRGHDSSMTLSPCPPFWAVHCGHLLAVCSQLPTLASMELDIFAS